MAWVRTATSLIAFGFTLYQFFFYLHEREPGQHPPQIFGARTFGLVMIGIGVFALVVTTWQHRQNMNRLRKHYRDAPFSLSSDFGGIDRDIGHPGFCDGRLPPMTFFNRLFDR